MTLVETMWEMADRELDKLLATGDHELTGDKLQQQRGILAGMTRMICLFMTPRFKTVKEVAEELNRRRRARETGENYTTPGLGSRIFEIPPELTATRPSVKERTDKVLDPDDQKAIKMALSQKIMTVAQICKMYSITKEVVEQLAVDANQSS